MVMYRIFVRFVSNKLAHSHFVPWRICPKLLGGFVRWYRILYRKDGGGGRFVLRNCSCRW